jgi:hypothetical protein
MEAWKRTSESESAGAGKKSWVRGRLVPICSPASSGRCSVFGGFENQGSIGRLASIEREQRSYVGSNAGGLSTCSASQLQMREEQRQAVGD